MSQTRDLRSRSRFTCWLRGCSVALAALAVVLLSTTLANAQIFTVIHDFSDGADGASPQSGLTIDRGGNLYGTVPKGGSQNGSCSGWGGCGVVYKLAHSGSAWLLTPLYQFKGQIQYGDGISPYSRVIFGPDGALYGTTLSGGGNGHGCSSPTSGCGTVFRLTPPPAGCRASMCSWVETQLYLFTGLPDAASPVSEVAFDAAGNLYGSAANGASSYGAVYQLRPTHPGWQESVLYSFSGGLDGGDPRSGVALDTSGNLYGTTWNGGSAGDGTVYQLANTGAGWTLNPLYNFNYFFGPFGSYAGVIVDSTGALYTASVNGSPNGDAYVFKLVPPDWTFNTLYLFPRCYGCGPAANLMMDSAGNLYGTTRGVQGFGSVFKLTPSENGWIYTDLHDFTGGADGGTPYSSVVMDTQGNLYGTASTGGRYGYGVAWEITP